MAEAGDQFSADVWPAEGISLEREPRRLLQLIGPELWHNVLREESNLVAAKAELDREEFAERTWPYMVYPDYVITPTQAAFHKVSQCEGALRDALGTVHARFYKLMADGAFQAKGRRGSPTVQYSDIPADAWVHFLVQDWQKPMPAEPGGIVWYGVVILPASAEPPTKEIPEPPTTSKQWLHGALSKFPKKAGEPVKAYAERLGIEAEKDGLTMKAVSLKVRYYEKLRGEW